MKIIASSLMDQVDRFLHAGYISAYPRPLELEIVEAGPPQLQLDVVEALRLQGETVASQAFHSAPQGVEVAMAGLAGGDPLTALAAGAAALAGVAGLSWLMRKAGLNPRKAALATALAAGTGLAACAVEELPTEIPWEGVQLQEYANPEAATQALMYGLIADGLSSIGQNVESLANIQYEVGFPTDELSEGMAYALSTYGIDGWGQEFRFEDLRSGGPYRVTSAGPDGELDTKDDLQMKVSRSYDGNWEGFRYAFYLDQHQGEHAFFFHRYNGELFQYWNMAAAQVLTGDILHDVVLQPDLERLEDLMALLDQAWEEEAADLDYEPLVLMVFQEL